jgi:hypothetical protein
MSSMYNSITVEDLRATFQGVYAGLPSSLRDGIVIVIDEKPYTWNSVYTEVLAKTKLGDRMLSELKELGII